MGNREAESQMRRVMSAPDASQARPAQPQTKSRVQVLTCAHELRQAEHTKSATPPKFSQQQNESVRELVSKLPAQYKTVIPFPEQLAHSRMVAALVSEDASCKVLWQHGEGAARFHVVHRNRRV